MSEDMVKLAEDVKDIVEAQAERISVLERGNSLLNSIQRVDQEEIVRLSKAVNSNNKDVVMLRCLEAAGVDNWSGYSYAYEIMKEHYPDTYKEVFPDDF